MAGERAFETTPPGTPSARRGRGTAVLLGLTLVFGAVFLVAGVVAGAWWVNRGGDVKESSFLDLRLTSALHDGPAAGGVVLDPSDVQPVLADVVQALRKAKDDPRISGIFLTVEDPALGWAAGQELREALVDFQSDGKPCVAYAETWTTAGYFVGSACGTVAVAPAGILLVNGLAVHVTFYAGLFEKIGVKAEMLHVGDFKSAVEPYERTEPSEPASEAMNLLLDSLWGDFVTEVAASRHLSEADLRARVDHPSLSPARAQSAGLVDVLAYPDQLRADLGLRVSDPAAWAEQLPTAVAKDDEALEEAFTELDEYLEDVRETGGRADDVIAVIHADGPITSGRSEGGLFDDAVLADKNFAEWVDAAREDDKVKAVVLRVNSPGGSALASDLMWRSLRRLQESGKPLVVSMGNYAASGGYYISAPADRIYAMPTTLTGSIGVFGGKITFGGTYEKIGLTEASYERGAEADLLSTTQLFTEEGRVAYQGFIDDFYGTFLARVGEGRELDRDAVHAVAQGRVWSGRQAKERGLVDELGGLEAALDGAGELAGITEWSVRRYPAPKTLFEALSEDFEGGGVAVPTVRLELPGVALDGSALADVAALAAMLESGPVALLPGRLRVE